MIATADTIAGVIGRHRYLYASEQDLHDGVEQVLDAAGFDVAREVRLSARDRIDLLVGRVGVEIKVDGTMANVARQCRRYMESDQVDELVLVTSRARHRLSLRVNGKPVVVVPLMGVL